MIAEIYWITQPSLYLATLNYYACSLIVSTGLLSKLFSADYVNSQQVPMEDSKSVKVFDIVVIHIYIYLGLVVKYWLIVGT